MPGSLAHSPADVVRWLLIQDGHGSDPAEGGAWPVYCPVEPADPDEVLAIVNTSGTGSGSDASGERQEYNGVQIKLRSKADANGWQKLREIAVALDAVSMAEVDAYDGEGTSPSATYLVHSLIRTGDVISLGRETPVSKRHVFTANFLVSLRQNN